MTSPASAARPRAAWKIMGWLTITGLALGLVGAGVLVATGAGYVPLPIDLTMADADAAYAACQGFARQQLKAPGPVTFAPIGRRTVRRFVDGRFRVRSHADATNAAGRLVEIGVACTMRPLGGDRWTLENLTIRSD